MRGTLTILTLVAAMSTGSASAEDYCFVPMSDWQPREAVARLAEKNGWTLRRIRIDDGCYKVYGQDSEGRAIEVTINPATLEEIEFEYEDEDGHRTRERDGQRHD